MRVPVGGCHVEMRPDRERILVLLHGELDLVTVEQVGAQLDELLSAGWRELTVNLAAVTFMDVAGVRLLLGLHERSDHVRLAFRVVCASPQVARILGLTRNSHLLDRHRDEHRLQ